MPAYLMWGFVHVMYLIGWGNRLGTVYTWARDLYLSKNRGHRIISFQNRRIRSRRPAHLHPDRPAEAGS